jgi:hypothetical protein
MSRTQKTSHRLPLLPSLWGVFWGRSAQKTASVSVLPWSAFFSAPRSTILVTSDPDIAEIESLTGNHLISISDYANHHYVPEPNALTPDVDKICRDALISNKQQLHLLGQPGLEPLG